MLYIVTALYEEASPFLQKFNLKRRTDFPHFELFAGENLLLLITRPGALRAAAALSSVLTAFPPERHDLLLSIGCAGCASAIRSTPDDGHAHAAPLPGQGTPLSNAPAIGQAFTICKITDAASGRTRYPELLYRTPFAEAEVITVSSVQTESHAPAGARGAFSSADAAAINSASREASGETPFSIAPLPVLYDMEAAGIYEAAIAYLPCDRILFVKVISDALTGLSELSAEERRTHVTGCISGVMEPLTAWLECLIAALCLPQNKDVFTAPEEEFFTEVCTALRLSVASSCKLRQLMLYLKLSKVPIASMRELLAAPLATPCRTKKEGLQYLEQLTKHYL